MAVVRITPSGPVTPSRTKRGKAERGKAERGKAERGKTERGRAERGPAKQARRRASPPGSCPMAPFTRACDDGIRIQAGESERRNGGSQPPPTLLFIVGPPAVGKMTVGDEIARRTGFRLFHNHLSIEPVLRIFGFGTDPFHRLVHGFRLNVFEEVAGSDLRGLIFTWVWAFDLPSDAEAVERYSAPFRDRESRVLFVELEASLEERLRRNETAFRLSEKASKRDVASSRRLAEVVIQHFGFHPS